MRRTATSDPALTRRVRGIARRSGLARPPAVRLLPARFSPAVWTGFRGPELLLPRAWLDRLTPAELDAVLAHELAHVARRDHWVRLLELLSTAFFWWHPVVWWARAELRRAEERCCDARVLTVLPGSARAYARGLLKTVEFVSGAERPVPVMGCGIGGALDIRERLTMILESRGERRLRRPIRLLLGVSAIAVLALFPVRAERATDEARDAERARAMAADESRREQDLALEARRLEQRLRELREHQADIDAERARRAYSRARDDARRIDDSRDDRAAAEAESRAAFEAATRLQAHAEERRAALELEELKADLDRQRRHDRSRHDVEAQADDVLLDRIESLQSRFESLWIELEELRREAEGRGLVR